MSTSKDPCFSVSLLRVRTQIRSDLVLLRVRTPIRSDLVGHRVITPLILEPVVNTTSSSQTGVILSHLAVCAK
jgi:hypothetical protein